MTKINSFHPIINQSSRVIILGSMPGVESLKKEQYYGNSRNHFWRIIFKLFDEEIKEDYEDKIAFIIENHIALWDVLSSCERQGSLDVNIKNEEVNNFEALLKVYPSIRFVGFNGSKAYVSFNKYIGFTLLKERNISFKKLPSTSPIPGRNIKTFEDKLKEWTVLKKFI